MRLLVPLLAFTSILLAGCAGDQMGASTAPSATAAAPTELASATVLSAPQDVRTVQIRLQHLKFYDGETSGYWNIGTEAAVQGFQRANGLAPGRLDQATLRAMGLGSIVMGDGRLTDIAYLRGPQMAGQGHMMGQGQMMGQGPMTGGPMRHGMGPGQQGQHPMAGIAPAAGPGPGAHMMTGRNLEPVSVRRVQQKLADEGYYKIAVDGIWGVKSQEALVAFQNSRSLAGTGRITPETVSALGIEQGSLKWKTGPRPMQR